MFDTRDKASTSNPTGNLGADQSRTASNWMESGTATTPGQLASSTATSGAREVPELKVDMDALFGNFGDEVTSGSRTTPEAVTAKPATDAKPATATATEADQSKPKPAPDKTAKDLKTELTNNPMATRSLDSLTTDAAYQTLTDEKKAELLKQFKESPNAATTNYLRGVADYEKEKAADKSGDPAKEKARLDKLENARTPDSGAFSINGTNYTITNGKLLGKDGKEAGTIDNLGHYQMTGDKEASSYYDNLSARVQLTEGSGKDAKSLLDLHATDPNGRLAGANMNTTFTGKVDETLKSMRHEGMDMGVAGDGAYRDFATQDRLYNQGRTAPGKKVTNARGGESYHNPYGRSENLIISILSVGVRNGAYDALGSHRGAPTYG